MIVLTLYWSNIDEEIVFFNSSFDPYLQQQIKRHLMSCVFATTKNTQYPKFNKTKWTTHMLLYCSQNRDLWYAKLLCSLLWAPEWPGYYFHLTHPWFKALKTWYVWFLANYRETKVPTSSVSLENMMPKSSLCQQKHCSFHWFFHWHRNVVM